MHPPDLGQGGQQGVPGDAAPESGQVGPPQAVGALRAEQQVQSAAPGITVDQEHARRGGQRHGRRDRARAGAPAAAADGHQPAPLGRGAPRGGHPREEPRLVVREHRHPLGTELDGRRPFRGRQRAGGHDDQARTPRQRSESGAAERIGADEHQGRVPVRAAQRRASGGEFRLGTGRGEQPEQRRRGAPRRN